jgi:putative glycerol-1-phosphate prenyltransferase
MFDFDYLKKSKSIALLIDPDETRINTDWINLINTTSPDLILIGGSQPFPIAILDEMVTCLKANCQIPLLAFPGDINQVNPMMDGLLALSVVQSFDARFILSPLFHISKFIDKKKISTFFTPYLILGGSGLTSVEKVLEDKINLIDQIDTLEDYLLGLKVLSPACIYLEAGSGSEKILNLDYVARAKNILPSSYIFAGGGVRKLTQLHELWTAGADCVVVGNWIERDKQALVDICIERNKINGC